MRGCILCASESPLAPRYTKDDYDIQTCQTCGLTQLNPMPTPEALDALYSGDYFSRPEEGTGYDGYAEQEREYAATFQEDVDRIRGFAPRGRILDIGCGFGYFMAQALERGYDAYGLDLSPEAVKVAAERFPGRVFQGTIQSVQALQDMTFDIIFASHLIEHITAPVPFVEDLRGRLTDGGILFMVTPNISSLLARLSGSRWVSFKIPEHVAYYNPGTITDLCQRAGLDVLALGGAYQHYSVPVVAEKLRELLDPLSRLVPRIEESRLLRERIIRVTSGSLWVAARVSEGST